MPEGFDEKSKKIGEKSLDTEWSEVQSEVLRKSKNGNTEDITHELIEKNEDEIEEINLIKGLQGMINKFRIDAYLNDSSEVNELLSVLRAGDIFRIYLVNEILLKHRTAIRPESTVEELQNFLTERLRVVEDEGSNIAAVDLDKEFNELIESRGGKEAVHKQMEQFDKQGTISKEHVTEAIAAIQILAEHEVITENTVVHDDAEFEEFSGYVKAYFQSKGLDEESISNKLESLRLFIDAYKSKTPFLVRMEGYAKEDLK